MSMLSNGVFAGGRGQGSRKEGHGVRPGACGVTAVAVASRCQRLGGVIADYWREAECPDVGGFTAVASRCVRLGGAVTGSSVRRCSDVCSSGAPSQGTGVRWCPDVCGRAAS